MPRERDADAVVLVVDDDDSIRAFLARALRGVGLTTLPASSAAAALARLQDEDQRVDILLADLHMPLMSGLELLERARAVRRGLPAVLLTGAASERAEETIHGIGGATLLVMPYTPQALREAVEAGLRRD